MSATAHFGLAQVNFVVVLYATVELLAESCHSTFHPRTKSVNEGVAYQRLGLPVQRICLDGITVSAIVVSAI